eukprot:2504587-Amphidinium_carterae.1
MRGAGMLAVGVESRRRRPTCRIWKRAGMVAAMLVLVSAAAGSNHWTDSFPLAAAVQGTRKSARPAYGGRGRRGQAQRTADNPRKRLSPKKAGRLEYLLRRLDDPRTPMKEFKDV